MTNLSDNARGALLMMASMAFFTFNDACFKALGEEVPLMQALFLRGLAVSVLMTVYVMFRGGLQLARLRPDAGRLALRTLAEIAAAYFFLTALYHMPLANVSAILQVAPLSVTLAAALFMSEPVGWKRLVAIAVGFGGVMLIVRPGTGGFTVYSLYAILAVLMVTVRDLVTRRMGRDVPSIMVALTTAVGVTVFAAVGSLTVTWVPVRGDTALQLAGSVVFVIVAYIASVATMRVGEVGFVAPFRYTSLLVALILGLVVFAEWPDLLTLVGSGIVVATGLFTLLRERALARARGKRGPAATVRVRG
jgi:drug/metabolite transporter (DMT)-like permease